LPNHRRARAFHLADLANRALGSSAGARAVVSVWFALRLGPAEFGIFDAFPEEAGRKAHLSGPIAAALMKRAGELLAEAPRIEQVEVLAAKLN